METQTTPAPNAPSTNTDSSRGIYRGVVLVFLGATFLGTVASIAASVMFSNTVLLDVAVTLGISTGVLIGVAISQRRRARSPRREPQVGAAFAPEDSKVPSDDSSSASRFTLISRVKAQLGRAAQWFRHFGLLGWIRIATAVAGAISIVLLLAFSFPSASPSSLVAASIAAVCLATAGLAGIAVGYLADLEPSVLPEAPGLCRGARVVAWVLVVAAISEGLSWAGQETAVRGLHFLILLIDAAVCYSLLTTRRPTDKTFPVFPLDFGVSSLLGSRTNVLASILDTGERQLGIDLRSTWALTVVSRSIVPLIIGLCLMGWLSTSLTVVDLQNQGLVERLGVPLDGQPLQPGLHLHWPWPVDRVFQIPVQRVQALSVGHEGEQAQGPENVLWAVEHAPNEYTLLLGNGRDLITVDATVQYRIVDARAWRYHSQNPADALRAIAYRAVMRSTVNHSLSEALSENVVTLTANMRAMVQHDADALGLGVKVEAFTVGGMHPPVPVAHDYEAVVSAELGKVTAVADAETNRNQIVPAAEATVLRNENTARAEGAQALALAAGEAWSFRALQSQYRAAPNEYFFRRRLETLERGLSGHAFTVVDARILRDGGELWLTQ
jgi:regulator of protease activity HflC (stomatin/prohibitin superfamily)